MGDERRIEAVKGAVWRASRGRWVAPNGVRTIMVLLLCGVCALRLVQSLGTALAENIPLIEPLFGWKLVREGDTCQALANFADGSRISYGFKRDGTVELTISFNSDKYNLPDKVSVDFDRDATYVLTKVPNSSPANWQMDRRWGNDFAVAIMNGRQMNLNIEERPVATFSLAGSANGISRAYNCSIGASAPAPAPTSGAEPGDSKDGPAALARINGEEVGCRRAWQVQGYAWICMQKPGTVSQPLPQSVTAFTTINGRFVSCNFSSKFDVLDVWACAVMDR